MDDGDRRVLAIREGFAQAFADGHVEERKPGQFNLTFEGRCNVEKINPTTPEAERTLWALTAPYDEIKHLAERGS